ncbi:TldD/PmbA family protein [Methanobrevibacter olleyae]|uniref:Peptidase U62 family n=1 Tax=Methanobrevibacter olleyae TaxID=294671 RepID=A0A126R0R1_METOL|nr:TldD/PmbA family protein [Methanobrevibacter olleyae]AMK15881.1 peptidase U62 family [Methanobrevibacter olleyae]SFL14564.1 PmbA protein [Methanobrevibacter olleyae]
MLYELAEEAKREILKYSDDYEIYLDNMELLQLDSQKTDLNFAKEEINLGIGIRIIRDGAVGFAFTSDMEKIAKTCENAYLNSKLNSKDENFSFAEVEKLPKIKGTLDKKFRELDLDELTTYLKSVLNCVEDNGCQTTSGGFSAAEEERLILNSNGVETYDKSTGFSLGISINAVKDGDLTTAYDSASSCVYDLDGIKLAEDICNLAKSSLGGEDIETSNKDLVLDYHAVTGLLSTFMSGFSADNIQRGRSRLAGKIGEKVVTDNLSIFDDGTHDGGLNSAISDDEGTASKRTTLVEDGILKGYLYDIYTANKDGVKSTSNGFRASYAGTPSVSGSNIIFDFKNSVLESEIKDAFLVTDLLGAHTANPITGDFSVEASNSFLINKGDKKPIKKAMISGNIYDLLADAIAVGDELKQRGSFIIPKLLLHDVRIIGT